MPTSVHDIVREAEKNYTAGTVLLSEHVSWSLRDTIERIYAYLNSTHTSGNKDSLGRDKPFFNIVTGAVNVWFKATDLDRKDISVQADSSSDVALAFIANVFLQNWMKEERFAVFLNKWGRTLAEYGSAIVKFIEKDGHLIPSVVPWNRAIVDPIDFEALPRIEKFYRTPAQLRKTKEYDQKAVKALIDAIQTRETLSGMQKDNASNFVELYEVHGELDVKYLLDDPKWEDEEDIVYRQQMHIISSVKGKDGKVQDFTLYKGKERRDPYMITHLIEEDGRTLSIGAVEYLFDAQWMSNHTMKNWKDQLDLSSKLIFQTADKSFVGRNVLTAIESGDILTHENQMPLEMVPNSGHDVTNLEAFNAQWKAASQDITSTPDAMRGKSMGLSVTAARQTNLLQQAAANFFELMTENKGLALEDMMREYIIPHIKTKMGHKDEVSAMLEAHDVQKIDSMYIPREAIRRYNKKALDTLTQGEVPPPFNPQVEQQGIKQELAPLGNQRFFTPDNVEWKDALKDLEWKLDVAIGNEQHDKQALFQTLSTVLQTLATNPMVLQDPNARMVFNKILDQTGAVSPIELSTAGAQQPPQQPGQPPGQPGAPMPMPQMQAPMATPSPLAALQTKR